MTTTEWREGVSLVMLAILCLLPGDVEPMTNRLSRCPESPNCVSSASQDGRHRVEPLRYEGPPAEGHSRLKHIVLALPRTRLVEERADYLRFEFRSLIFGFVDDVEFYWEEQPGTIQVRSASRTGYWDLGTNRRRIEQIRKAFDEANRSS